MTKLVVLYAFDTMADWEYAYISTVLTFQNLGGDDRFRLRTASVDGAEVRTLGGLRLVPDGRLSDIDEDDVAMLLLPGGRQWDRDHHEVLDLARRLLDAGTPVAGICGATPAMARAGLFEHHAHTVDPDDVPASYPGQESRVASVAVLDPPLVTAVGEAPLEFSREVFRVLGLDSAEGIDEWYGTFKDVPDARG